MPSLLRLRKFARSPNKVNNSISTSNEPTAVTPMYQSGRFECSPVSSSFDNGNSINNSDLSYHDETVSGESSPETPRPYQNGVSTLPSSCYDDDILFQVEVNATGVETYATSSGNPPSSNGSSNHRQWHRRPPPSSNSSSDSYQQLLSSSFDKYANGHMKPVSQQMRALTPPSSLFHKHSSHQHRNTGATGLTVQPISRPYSIAGQTAGTANPNLQLPTYQECVLSSAPCNSAATTPGNTMDLTTPAAPPPSIVTGPPVSNSSNKVILYPYVFRPVRPSKSSGQISSNLQATSAPISHHNSRLNGHHHVTNDSSSSSNISPGSNGHHVQRPLSSTELHYPAVNGGRKQKFHSHQMGGGDPMSDSQHGADHLMTTSLQLPRVTASGAHCRTDCPSINSLYSNSGLLDLETQLRWKDTELKQLRTTMQNNESAMTKLLDETAQEYERKLTSERQKSNRLEAMLKTKGHNPHHDVSVQTSLDDLYPQSHQFESERTRWLEEKAKVIAYQRQIQLSYLQLVRKCQRLENDIEQLNKELEEKDKQLLLNDEFSQLNVEQLQQFSAQSHQHHSQSLHSIYPNGMKRSASSDDKMTMFLHLDPEETAC